MAADFHSHILPCMDDGSDSLDMSVVMLRKEAEQGIDKVVLTPHFYPHRDDIRVFLKKRGDAYRRLTERLERESGFPRLYLGAEVYFYRGMSDSDMLSSLAVEGTSYILIEMPFVSWTDSMYQELEEIYTKRGLTPVIAHVDRYLSLSRTKKLFGTLSELPVLVQANADFFLGKSSSKKALKLLAEERIHLLGSDCHNLGDRPPNLGAALSLVSKRLGENAVSFLRSEEEQVLGGI